MSHSRVTPEFSIECVTSDRYKDNREQLMVHTLYKAVTKIKSLPAGQKEAFVASFVKGATQLSKHQDNLIVSRVKISTTLPDTLLKPTVLHARNRKRLLTSTELSERKERDHIRDTKRATREAKATHRENQEITEQIRDKAVNARA